MQAIITKYHGPTNTRGSRYSATSASGIKVFVGCDNSLDSDQNHKAACEKLLEKLNWKGKPYHGGHLRDSMVWVHAETALSAYVAPTA